MTLPEAWWARAALLALVATSIPLAAPGVDFVPAAASDAPGWLLGPTGRGFGVAPGTYLGLLIAATLAWVAVVALAPRIGGRLLVGTGLGLVVLFTLAPPLHSLDVFSYVSYARLDAVHGLNPYDYAPSAIPADEAASRVQDFRDAVSVYGPIFTGLSYPLGLVGVPVALWAFKLIGGLSIVGLAWVTAKLAAARGLDPARAASFVALNPLVLAHVVGGAHNDGLMMFTVMAALAILTLGPVRSAAATMTAAIAIKVSAAVVLPFAVLGQRGQRDRHELLGWLVVFATTIGVGSILVFGSGVFEAVGVAGGNQSTISHYSVPATTARVLGADPELLKTTFAVAYAVLVGFLLYRTAKGADWIWAAAWAALGLLVASAYMAPWYLVWALPLVAISRDPRLYALAAAMTALQLASAIPL